MQSQASADPPEFLVSSRLNLLNAKGGSQKPETIGVCGSRSLCLRGLHQTLCWPERGSILPEAASPDALGAGVEADATLRGLARGRLILVSKLYKILILQSGNLGGRKTQQWETLVMQH